LDLAAVGGKKRRVTEEVEMEGRDRGRCVLVDINAVGAARALEEIESRSDSYSGRHGTQPAQ
jgi:hypothetical protein